jgi:hypothetical protein
MGAHIVNLIVDRTVGNTIEQGLPFVVSLWLYAVFVSPKYAAMLGYIYVISRSYYPFVFSGFPWILSSTLPGYLVISFCVGSLVYEALI